LQRAGRGNARSPFAFLSTLTPVPPKFGRTTAGARHDEELANASSLHILSSMGRYLLLALQHFVNAKNYSHFRLLQPIVGYGDEFLAPSVALPGSGARLVEARRGKTLL
jgi:hypothetical protein